MKPKPFSSLNHLTVPVAMFRRSSESVLYVGRADRTTCSEPSFEAA
jgi:hypothetical protein